MKIMFMGTPDFAVACLERIINDGHEVVGVVTQPDKPKGRGHKLTPPPVKEVALENGLKVYQPTTLKNGAFLEVLEETKPELLVVVAYGKILPSYVLDYPKYGAINVHASLLPEYRGAAPIQWAIIDRKKESGVTTMYMDEGLDTGDMLIKKTVAIGDKTTYGDLHDMLMPLGAEALGETIAALENGTLKREKQGESPTDYAKMIDKDLAHIDFSKKGADICALIRGLNPIPLAFCLLGGETMKVLEADYEEKEHNEKIGTACSFVKGKGFQIACADGYIYLKTVKPQGKKVMDIQSFLNGNKIEEGTIFE